MEYAWLNCAAFDQLRFVAPPRGRKIVGCLGESRFVVVESTCLCSRSGLVETPHTSRASTRITRGSALRYSWRRPMDWNIIDIASCREDLFNWSFSCCCEGFSSGIIQRAVQRSTMIISSWWSTIASREFKMKEGYLIWFERIRMTAILTGVIDFLITQLLLFWFWY